MLEIWKPIEEFPDYAVSNFGRIQSSYVERELKYSLVQNGIPTVGLLDADHRQKRRSVAILVAEAFVEKPQTSYRVEFDTPINLDGNRQNCRADNLVWRPRWFAVRFHKERVRNEFAPYWGKAHRILCVETDEIFRDPDHVAQVHGVLAEDVVFKALHNEQTSIFPHRFHYVMIK